MSLLAATALLAGCAWGSDVKKTAGSDTYTVSQTYAPVRGGIPKAKSVALEMARNKCAQLGREFYARGRNHLSLAADL